MGYEDQRALTRWPLGEQKTRLREIGKDPQWNEFGHVRHCLFSHSTQSSECG